MDFTEAGMLTRLRDALHREYEALAPLREQRARLISLAAGPKYPHKSLEEGWETPGNDPLNLLGQAAEADAISLAAERPRFMCSSSYVDRLAFSMHYENALNAYAKTMKLEEELRDVVMNGFYSLGIAKVYMADSIPVLLESNEWMDPGRPYVQSISPHHFIYDTSATSFRSCAFMADRYRVSFKKLVTDPRFKPEMRKKIKEKGPLTRRELAEAEPGKSLAYDDTELEPLVFLSDVFVLSESKVYTFLVDQDFNVIIDDPLAELDWDGAETGPFHIYSRGVVPDKTTPSSPAQRLELLHNLNNSLYRKLERQAESQKTIQYGDKADEEDITAARDAGDLAWLALTNPGAFGQFRVGGPDQNVFAFFLNALDQYDSQAGNLKFRLGTGQSADTNGQEQLIAQNVSRAEGYTRIMFYNFLRGVAKELARLLFESNTTEVAAQRRINEFLVVDDPWKGAVEEGSREGEFNDYDIDVDMSPMSYKPPGQKAMELQQTFAEIMQLAPITMQQGLMPDVQYYLKEKARLLNNTCLERLLVAVPPPEEQAGGSHERSLAPGGPKEYIHRSAGGGSGSGQQGNPQMAMMAAGEADNQTQ